MRYHNITKDDMLNGDGLRVVLWTSGCSHGCKECHNPVTWDEFSGLLFDQTAKEELFEELRKEYIAGVTFSGGDPLFPGNRADISSLAKEIKKLFPKKTIWLYTGFVWDDIKELEVIPYLDVVVDGKFEKALHNPKLHWKGSSNQKIINVKETLKSKSIVLHE